MGRLITIQTLETLPLFPTGTVRASDEYRTNAAAKKEKRVQGLHGDQEGEIEKGLSDVQKKEG